MNFDALFVQFRELLGKNLPGLIVLVVCALVTIVQWRRHPPSARWAFSAFTWFLIVNLVAIAWYTIGYHMLLAGVEEPDAPAALITMGLSCLEGLGYLLFLGAVNAARVPYRPSHFYDDFAEEALPPSAS